MFILIISHYWIYMLMNFIGSGYLLGKHKYTHRNQYWMEEDVKNGQENISPPFSTGCCFQVWRPRVLWPVWNDSFLSQDLIGTLILGVGQVVLELWLIENHWFLENSEIWTDLNDWKSCIFGTFFKMLTNEDHSS